MCQELWQSLGRPILGKERSVDSVNMWEKEVVMINNILRKTV
jgi:hypothetical protein